MEPFRYGTIESEFAPRSNNSRELTLEQKFQRELRIALENSAADKKFKETTERIKEKTASEQKVLDDVMHASLKKLPDELARATKEKRVLERKLKDLQKAFEVVSQQNYRLWHEITRVQRENAYLRKAPENVRTVSDVRVLDVPPLKK